MRLLLILFTITDICAYLITDYSYRQTHAKKKDIAINQVSDVLQLICNSLFTLEIVFGVIALGFVMGKNTFLREVWNIILLVILICGQLIFVKKQIQIYLTFSYFKKSWISRANYDSLVINIIKFLRILTFFRLFPELMKKVNAFFSSFQHLGKTFFPLICVVTFYAVVGMSFFQGHAESRCRLTQHPENIHGEVIWEADESNELPCGSYQCHEGTYCGNPADYGLPFNKKEAKAESLLFGYNLFNSIEWALFAVYNFLMVTGWIQTTYMYWRAQDKAISAIYFVSLVLFLSQVISNIILATLYEGFVDQTSIKNQQSNNENTKQDGSVSDKDSQNFNALDSGKPLKKKTIIMNVESEENDDNSPNNRINLKHQDNQQSNKNLDSPEKYPLSITRVMPQEHVKINKEQIIQLKCDTSPNHRNYPNEFLQVFDQSPFIKIFFLLNIFLQILVLCLDNNIYSQLSFSIFLKN